MNEFTAELVGTFLLILLGCSVNANVGLKKTTGHDSGWILTSAGWGVAVTIAIYSVVNFSGAHINPAVTLGLASIGEMNTQTGMLDTSRIATYLAGQFIGAILGATTVWLAYLPHWEATPDKSAKLGVFSTGPAIDKPGCNFLTELIGTFALVLGVLAIFSPDALTPVQEKLGGDKEAASIQQQWAFGLKPLLVGLLVFVIGMGLGGPTGYAINPARDLGPRIAHAILPIAGKGDSNWSYAWVPVVGPCLGGILGALVYKWLWMAQSGATP
ncbi:MAG: MIP/aquaporin family protein [Verrucomicrobiota bacterium]|nr:MIP/aquaporin family protein [Verrucomicrobiota bacterium]